MIYLATIIFIFFYYWLVIAVASKIKRPLEMDSKTQYGLPEDLE